MKEELLPTAQSAGQPAPGFGRVGLKEIARQLGVSKTTVALALKGHPRISEKRRKEVRELATRLGYSPDLSGAALAYRKWESAEVGQVQGVIAWLNTWPSPPVLRSFREFDGYWRGAERAAASRGYRLEEFSARTPAELSALDRILHHRGIRGLLIPPVYRPGSIVGLTWERYATVKFGRSVEEPVTDIVTYNQACDTVRLLEMIRAKGYRRIGMSTCHRTSRFLMFDMGFLKARESWPAEERLPLLVFPDKAEDGHKKEQLRHWIREVRPDVMVSSDSHMKYLLESIGVHVPQDIALAATSVLDCDSDTGLFQNSEEIGKVAVESVVNRMLHGRFGLPEYPHEILVRGTWVSGSTLPVRAILESGDKEEKADGHNAMIILSDAMH